MGRFYLNILKICKIKRHRGGWELTQLEARYVGTDSDRIWPHVTILKNVTIFVTELRLEGKSFLRNFQKKSKNHNFGKKLQFW